MKTVIFIICVIACCEAQTPEPCKSPEQWEGRIYRSDRSKQFIEIGKASYDEKYHRVRIIEEDTTGSTRDYYDTLTLYNIRREYKLNLKTGECVVTDLTLPFRPVGVPPNAKFMYEATVGAAGVPGESLLAQAWSGETADHARFITTVTYPDCLPLTYEFYSNETGFIHSAFYDLTLGITDPMVFIPPRECNKV